MTGETGNSALPGTTIVRELGQYDLAGLRALAAAAGRENPVAAITEAEFAAWIGGGCCFVADLGGEVAGCLLAQPISYLDDVPLTVWVDNVLVRPAVPGHDVAAELFRAFGLWGREARVRAALTRIADGDADARSLFRSAGFVPHATGALVWRFDDS